MRLDPRIVMPAAEHPRSGYFRGHYDGMTTSLFLTKNKNDLLYSYHSSQFVNKKQLSFHRSEIIHTRLGSELVAVNHSDIT